MSEEEKTPEQMPEPSGAEEQPVAVSRRQFLIGAGAGLVVGAAGAAGVIAVTTPPAKPAEVAKPAPPAEPKPEVKPEVKELPPNLRRVTLNIDGANYETVVDVRESLWEVMTHKLGLGSRINLGCDRAMCGTCGVVVDGRSVYGCTALAARLGRGQKILTGYGMAKGIRMEDLHPIQKAFLENFGFQCAICSRGFIASSYALLSKNNNPTEEQVRKALEGNICRCGNYTKIFDSVFVAAKAMRG